MLRDKKQWHYKMQSGQALVETLIVMPLAAMLIFATIELSYAYRAKSTLNMATFEAVRAGALSNADKQKMLDALSSGLVPLHIKKDTSYLGIALAKQKTRLYLSTMASLDILSPTKSMFNKFSEEYFDLDLGRVVKAIPNDNLNWRSSQLFDVQLDGELKKVNIQDANILKIKVRYCHPLIVPVLDKLIATTIATFTLDSLAAQCNASGGLLSGSRYIVLESTALIRMQSPIFSAGLK
ncbi:TadE/TadG family type IV pilus assembly protein [Motilimonas pumila]|uniref:Pilus assembly protein n=1 Tax=Motilimonas pumila TaxID=2303987 RepID=A0A418YAH3_9GAMM|nr:TadE family protein [Motilimonas pumila]RJG39521.1 pilus assembly protein [Motilimonas pumila]